MRLDVSPVRLPDEQASSFSRSVAPSSSGTDVPYYRLTKMRFAYKNNKNPCGSKILCTLFAILVNIVDAKQRSCEGGNLSKTDEKGLVDLSVRLNKDPAKEENQPAQGEDGGSE